jgi:hypothetical protein
MEPQLAVRFPLTCRGCLAFQGLAGYVLENKIPAFRRYVLLSVDMTFSNPVEQFNCFLPLFAPRRRWTFLFGNTVSYVPSVNIHSTTYLYLLGTAVHRANRSKCFEMEIYGSIRKVTLRPTLVTCGDC